MIRNSVYALVETEKRFRDSDGGVFVDTTWHPELYAMAEGIVVSAPEIVKDDPYRRVTQNVIRGDKVFFSYAVIFDYVRQPDGDSPEYRNMVLQGGREYWRVPLNEIFARKDEIGLWSMVADMIMVEPEKEEYSGLILTRHTKESGRVKALPNENCDFSIGDIVFFEERYVQEYKIEGKDVFLIPTRRIIAKESE